jgi:hypothetical protein
VVSEKSAITVERKVMSQSRTIVNQSNLLRSWFLNSAKRRLYASQEELLALESEAKKQKLPRSKPGGGGISQLEEPAGHSPWEPGSPAVQEQAAAGFSATQAGEPNIGEQPVLIIVDQRITMRFGERRTAKSVVASKTAAFLAWQAVSQGKSVGAIIFDDQKILKLQPQCSRLRVRLILHALLSQNHGISQSGRPRANLGRLNEVLRRSERIATGNFLIFLISDASGYNEQTSCIVKRLSRRNNFLIVRVYDPRQSLHLAYSLPVESSQRRLEADSSEELPEPPHSWQTQIGQWPFPSEAPVIPLNTQRNLTQQLHRALKSLNALAPPGKTRSGLNHPAIETRPARDEEFQFVKDWDRTAAVQSEKA